MTTPDSAYAKPFLMAHDQIRRPRERGMECGTDDYASGVWKRYSLSPKDWGPGPFRSFVDLYDLFTPGNTEVTGIDACRVWVGDYRIVYDVADAVRIVTVSYVGQCREIYHNI